MPANSDAALADDAEELSPFHEGEFVTRTEFDLAVKQIMVKLINVQIRSLKTNIGVLEALLNNILKQ